MLISACRRRFRPGERFTVASTQARNLRKRMTPQEVKLWVKLRELKEQGLHFRRQVPRRNYIVDFACLKWRVLVEVDGSQHGMDGHLRQDQMRDRILSEDVSSPFLSGTPRSTATSKVSSRRSWRPVRAKRQLPARALKSLCADPSRCAAGERLSGVSSGGLHCGAEFSGFCVEPDKEFTGESDAVTFFSFPASRDLRWASAKSRTSRRTRSAMTKRIEATCARPPHIDLCLLLAASLAIGARPTSFAMALLEMVPISGSSAMMRATLRSATHLIDRKTLSRFRHKGSWSRSAAIMASSSRIWRARMANSPSKLARTAGSVIRRRWFFWAVRNSVSWRKRVTNALSFSWAWLAGCWATMRLTSPNQAMTPASIDLSSRESPSPWRTRAPSLH